MNIGIIREHIKKKLSEIKKNRVFNREQQLELLEDLILALNAKQSPLEAMRNSLEFCTPKNRTAYSEIYSVLNRGASLSRALDGWFDPMIVLSIKAGEGNRRQIQALENAKTTLENQSGVTGKIVKANGYPLFLIILGNVMNAVVAQLVIEPMLVDKPILSFPVITQISYSFGKFFMYNWYFLVLAVFSLIFVIQIILATWTADVRFSRFDNFIIFKQYRILTASSFLRSMAVMLKSKQILKTALDAVKESSDPYLANHAKEMLYSISDKTGVGQVMDTGLLLDQEIARIKSITSKSNDGIDELLVMVAERHEKVLNKSLDRIGKYSGYFGLLVVGLLIVLAFAGQMAAQLANAGMTF
ncbi:type II secretion system F family protein [Vibrio gangliei]|uniref:type II secretion system F family protein n=1 Tax=Vibrio gangliei TaxID=2077090 RepID=UPI000D0128B0|nr:type II secretion system F family protein [Vibrio gangliei]